MGPIAPAQWPIPLFPTSFYLKLGGSLITDKRQAETARPDVIERLAAEIAEARRAIPGLRLVLGHGSGSFGHVVGKRYGTRHGVSTPEGWYGFAATGDAAARLNRIVTSALLAAGIPAWSIQPGAALLCRAGRIVDGPAATVARALDAGLVPVVFGDVALDGERGGVIVSTEEIFDYLGEHLPPARMILAGEVDGIFSADPLLHPEAERIPSITPATASAVMSGLGASHGVDVTGGMAAKVGHVLDLLAAHPGLEVVICSGLQPGNVARALLDQGHAVGTRLWNPG